MSNSNVHTKSFNQTVLLVIMFLTGFSLFLYEIMLTRLFSVILNFNLVFLVVSFSILGSGLGGIWTHKIVKNKEKAKLDSLLQISCVGIPLSILIGIMVMYFMPFISVYSVYAIIGAIPFFFGGILISCLFMENSKNSHNMYLMDLVGSGLGSIGFIALMNQLGFIGSVLVICMITLISSVLIYIYYNKRVRLIFSLLGIIALFALVIQGDLIRDIETSFGSYYSSPNTTFNYLKGTNENDIDITFSKWDSIARTDVIETSNKKEKLIVTDGGATAPIVQFNGELATMEYMKYDVNYIPFTFGNNDKTLLIGSGGGKDILFSLLGGSKEIHAIEINPSTISAANYYKDYSGDIYNRPEVELHVQDGRNFVDNSEDDYNNIYLSMVMTNAVENTMYSLSENYIYTTEAFSSYLNRLTTDGKLSFMMHSNVDLLKIVNTGIKVLLDRGVSQDQVTNYFVIVNGRDLKSNNAHNSSIVMPLVMFKNEPFTQSEIEIINAVAKIQNKELVHYPGSEDPMFKLLKDEKLDFEEMINQVSFNVKPITDNSPFFYNYSMYFPKELLFVLLGVLSICLILKRKYINTKELKNKYIYFMGLGVAFMLVEIPIIQKMIRYFGNPSFAFSIILFSILLSTGIGSGLSGTKALKKLTSSSPIYLLWVSLSIFVFQLNIGKIMDLTVSFDFNLKILVTLITIAPMGLLMGLPFAIGMRKLNESNTENFIPLMWGVNGLFSVLGSVLAVIISMKVGFNATIYLGASIYLLLFIANPLKGEIL